MQVCYVWAPSPAARFPVLCDGAAHLSKNLSLSRGLLTRPTAAGPTGAGRELKRELGSRSDLQLACLKTDVSSSSLEPQVLGVPVSLPSLSRCPRLSTLPLSVAPSL